MCASRRKYPFQSEKDNNVERKICLAYVIIPPAGQCALREGFLINACELVIGKSRECIECTLSAFENLTQPAKAGITHEIRESYDYCRKKTAKEFNSAVFYFI